MTVLEVHKVRGGWWRMTVTTDGVLHTVVVLGTRDESVARQKLDKYRKMDAR